MNKPTNNGRRPARRPEYMPPRPIRAVEVSAQPAAVTPVPPIGTLPQPVGIDSMPLAMAYVPMQRWGEVYPPEKALAQGTIFPDLDLPFMRGGK